MDAASWSAIRNAARRLACQAIRSAQGSLREQNYELKFCALRLASGRPLPALPPILASHALIHSADGELFRQALLYAGKRCGIEVFIAKRRRSAEDSVEVLLYAAGEACFPSSPILAPDSVLRGPKMKLASLAACFLI